MGPIPDAENVRFRCNICGQPNEKPRSSFGREIESCDGCGSTVRTRAVVRMLSRELFGAEMALPDFPVMRSLRGIGMSDSDDFASRLASKFDYRNTHYDKQPRLDVMNPSPADIGAYDFIISSEVLEHVEAPVERAFQNLFRMLKPAGVLLLTVPYEIEGAVKEHFGPMTAFGLARVDGLIVLVRRAVGGGYEVLDNLVFHGGHGSTLEMRVFSEAGLRECLRGAGFELEIYAQGAPEFGVLHDEAWSLPIAARKGQFAFSADTRREWSGQWVAAIAAERRAACELAQARASAQRALDEVHAELEARTAWAQDLSRRLDAKALAAGLDAADADSPESAAHARALALRYAEELGAARERIAGLEALLRERLWSRLKRKFGARRRTGPE